MDMQRALWKEIVTRSLCVCIQKIFFLPCAHVSCADKYFTSHSVRLQSIRLCHKVDVYRRQDRARTKPIHMNSFVLRTLILTKKHAPRRGQNINFHLLSSCEDSYKGGHFLLHTFINSSLIFSGNSSQLVCNQSALLVGPQSRSLPSTSPCEHKAYPYEFICLANAHSHKETLRLAAEGYTLREQNTDAH